ncbi:hypothetical protein AALM50_24025 [Enterobacter kobei]|uniref:hypothetical protein n=1 Tax=Enterobacter kobei TaxID=208224 RepID=UPI00351616B1
MSTNDLAVKYGTYQPENLLVILPLEEASDIIRESLAPRFATSWNMNTMTVFLLLKKRHLIGNHGQTATNAMLLVLPER